MKTRKLTLLLLLVLFTIGANGCLGGGSNSVNPDPNSDSYFELHVSPEGLVPSQLQSKALLNVNDLRTPTHVAARLVYENGDTYQRTTNNIDEGIISLQVPPGEAVLQVVVVHEGERSGRWDDYALLTGAVENNIVIREGEVHSVETNTLEFEEFSFSWLPEDEQRLDPITKEYRVTPQDVVEGHYSMGETIRLEGYLNNPIYSPNVQLENQRRFLAYQEARNGDTKYSSDSFRADLIADFEDYRVASAPQIYLFAQATVEVDDTGNYQFAMIDRDKELVDKIDCFVGVYLEGSDWGLPHGKYFTLQTLKSNSPNVVLTWDR